MVITSRTACRRCMNLNFLWCFTHRRIAKVLLFLVPCLPASSQDLQNVLNSAMDNWFRFYRSRIDYDVYLHPDKAVYSKGQPVFFSAYLFHNDTAADPPKSFIAAITDEWAQELVTYGQFPLSHDRGSGVLYLPDSMTPGWYTLIAYPPERQLYHDNPLFSTTIQVDPDRAGPRKSRTVIHPVGPPDNRAIWHVRYRPEGGTIVAGRSAYVGIYIEDNFGQPVGMSGELLENGIPVRTFHTDSLGIAAISYQFDDWKKYEVRFPGLSSIIVMEGSFPEVFASGYSLSVRNNDTSQRVNIFCRPRRTDQNFVLFIYNRHAVAVGFEEPKSDYGVLSSPLTNYWPPGLYMITVLDSLGHVRAEQPVFKKGEGLVLKIKPDSTAFRGNGKIAVRLQVTDSFSVPRSCALSASLALTDQMPTPQEPDIEAYPFFDPVLFPDEKQKDLLDVIRAKDSTSSGLNYRDKIVLAKFPAKDAWQRLTQIGNGKPELTEFARFDPIIDEIPVLMHEFPDTENHSPKAKYPLHWLPDIATDKDGIAMAVFDNPGRTGIYRVSVQGVCGKTTVSGHAEIFVFKN